MQHRNHKKIKGPKRHASTKIMQKNNISNIWCNSFHKKFVPRKLFFNCDSLCEKLNSHYETWSYKKKKYKKIKSYRKSI